MILRTVFFVAVVALGTGIHAADLVTPPMTHEAPAAGKRVWQQAPEYRVRMYITRSTFHETGFPEKNTRSLLNTPETSFHQEREAAK